MNKEKNILVTGGAGYIGSHVALSLLDKGYSVTILDSLITGNEKILPSKANFIKCDIADTKIILGTQLFFFDNISLLVFKYL